MTSTTFEFEKEHMLAERKDKAHRITAKYPDRIPVICEKDPKSKLNEMEKAKILVPKDLSVAQFIKRIKLKPEETIFLFINNKLVHNGALMADVYENNKREDGFLYVRYSSENYFG
ncbi:hypothetical protein RFI_06402 [Reticulomyxa filosa]|uniref:Autophagy-related protein n=1 Tax=Reticulomyxa filosa TaxID=46433 RepID=X6NXV9_RETFI|nr:hypothetical protein RFI_06402 [Reticulomyxa filosa]|eukprot:ETO30718.1 hypothetical protein RFI_06402 [Reticulomyxa filosa]